MDEKILVLDFGGQYNQLIARRVREQNVYCEIKPYTLSISEIRAFAPMGIIFTGGPNSVYLEESPPENTEDAATVYDMEPDKNDDNNAVRALPRRVRFYHAMID